MVTSKESKIRSPNPYLRRRALASALAFCCAVFSLLSPTLHPMRVLSDRSASHHHKTTGNDWSINHKRKTSHYTAAPSHVTKSPHQTITSPELHNHMTRENHEIKRPCNYGSIHLQDQTHLHMSMLPHKHGNTHIYIHTTTHTRNHASTYRHIHTTRDTRKHT